MKSFTMLTLLCVFFLGCAIGPNYKKPVLDIPNQYRGLKTEESLINESASLGEQQWWEVFKDEKLQQLIRTALEQNYDMRIAATNIVQAQAQLNITGSYLFPSLTAGVSANGQRVAQQIKLLLMRLAPTR